MLFFKLVFRMHPESLLDESIKFILFPCMSFWSACREHQSQNLPFSIIILNLSRTKRGCVIWWVYRHGLNLSPAANYFSHIRIIPPQYCLLYLSVSWLWWTMIVNWCKEARQRWLCPVFFFSEKFKLMCLYVANWKPPPFTFLKYVKVWSVLFSILPS